MDTVLGGIRCNLWSVLTGLVLLNGLAGDTSNFRIMDATGMLGFQRSIVFFRVNEASVAEKSWLPCPTADGCGRRRLSVEMFSNCEHNGTDGSK